MTRPKATRASALLLDLDDAETVLALVEAAKEVPCDRCHATGVDPVPFGSLSRTCEACNGTKVGGLAARRTIAAHAVQVARTLARIVHHQRPTLPLPGLSTGASR